ncbi:MAG: hypothetical protein ACYCYO_21435, partial [Bacilli bacterium]
GQYSFRRQQTAAFGRQQAFHMFGIKPMTQADAPLSIVLSKNDRSGLYDSLYDLTPGSNTAMGKTAL